MPNFQAPSLADTELQEVSQLRRAYADLLKTFEAEALAHEKLQKAYAEQQIMIRHQQKLVSMVKELYGEQVQVAATDPLTGLPNHRTLMSRIDETVLQCQQTEEGCALLFVDLDYFKRINDTYGHRAGDAVLQEVGRRMQKLMRKSDSVGRYGGEEFAIILPGTDLAAALRVAECVRESVVSQACTWESEETQCVIEIPVTASIGVSVYGADTTTRDALIEAADKAMYMAKHGGRNRVCQAGSEDA